jgi:hypothetical protein
LLLNCATFHPSDNSKRLHILDITLAARSMSLCQECVELSKAISLVVASKFKYHSSQQSFDHKLSSDATCQLCKLFRDLFPRIRAPAVGGQLSVRVSPLWQAFDELSLNFKDIWDPVQACCVDRLRIQALQAEIPDKNSNDMIAKTRLSTVDLQAFCISSTGSVGYDCL